MDDDDDDDVQLEYINPQMKGFVDGDDLGSDDDDEGSWEDLDDDEEDEEEEDEAFVGENNGSGSDYGE